MENHVFTQFTQFLLALVFGFGCVAVYDALRLIRRTFRRRKPGWLFDAAYILVLAPAAFIFALLVTDGVLRWHIVTAALAAAAVYSFGVKHAIYEHIFIFLRRKGTKKQIISKKRNNFQKKT